MKKIILLVLIPLSIIAFAQQTYVPDDNFEQFMIDKGWDDVLDDYVLTANISDITGVYAGNQNISDMTGIEDFTSMTSLSCYGNNLTTLDVSSNINLMFLLCNNNQLTDLNITGCTQLKNLSCYNNNLGSLDFSTNTSLENALCYNNSSLSDINFDGAISLLSVSTYNTPITNLDFSNNPIIESIHCNDGSLTTINVNGCLNLELIGCYNNSLTTLDLTTNTSLRTLLANDNLLNGDLDLSNCPGLFGVHLHNNLFSNIDIRNGNNINIGEFKAQNNPLLTCIFVDDAAFSQANWPNVDPTATYVETQAECDALGIEEITYYPNVNFYPNPADDHLNISIASGLPVTIKIIDMTGKVILKRTISGNKENILDVSSLQKGVYLLQYNMNGSSHANKLTIH